MTNLYDTIKKDRITFRKSNEKLKVQSLTTLLGELQTEEKRGVVIDDGKVISSIKKTLLGLIELQGLYLSRQESPNPLIQAEIDFLGEYVPKQLTAEELEAIIWNSGATDVGQVMKFLKENYYGKYDGRLASTIAKRLV